MGPLNLGLAVAVAVVVAGSAILMCAFHLKRTTRESRSMQGQATSPAALLPRPSITACLCPVVFRAQTGQPQVDVVSAAAAKYKDRFSATRPQTQSGETSISGNARTPEPSPEYMYNAFMSFATKPSHQEELVELTFQSPNEAFSSIVSASLAMQHPRRTTNTLSRSPLQSYTSIGPLSSVIFSKNDVQVTGLPFEHLGASQSQPGHANGMQPPRSSSTMRTSNIQGAVVLGAPLVSTVRRLSGVTPATDTDSYYSRAMSCTSATIPHTSMNGATLLDFNLPEAWRDDNPSLHPDSYTTVRSTTMVNMDDHALAGAQTQDAVEALRFACMTQANLQLMNSNSNASELFQSSHLLASLHGGESGPLSASLVTDVSSVNDALLSQRFENPGLVVRGTSQVDMLARVSSPILDNSMRCFPGAPALGAAQLDFNVVAPALPESSPARLHAQSGSHIVNHGFDSEGACDPGMASDFEETGHASDPESEETEMPQFKYSLAF